MRARSAALPIAALAVLFAAATAVAGGWAQVSASTPADPPAGQETTIELEVFQHGLTAVSWPRLTVVATDAASGTVVRADARPVGPEGSYVATIVFPNVGAWTLTFESVDLVMEGTASIRVAPAIAGGAGTATSPAPALGVLPVVGALVAAGAILAAGTLLIRRRVVAGAHDAGADARASAGT